MSEIQYSFPRYLAAKTSVDDRALNRQVWDALASHLSATSPVRPLRVLEAGAGTGTMLERMVEWGLLGHACYTAVDSSLENREAAFQRLPRWAEAHGFRLTGLPGEGLIFEKPGSLIELDYAAQDLFDFAPRQLAGSKWDLLVAHAFLDLLDIPAALPVLFKLLKPGALFYFTLNFDGVTLFEPPIDPTFDELIERLYHCTMDERITAGRRSGDSRSGRHLFGHLRQAGAQILAAGASDWVVHPSPQGYPGDEAYFLHHIIHFIEGSLAGRPELDPAHFSSWAAKRHAQIERGELVYIAHQLDFLGRAPLS